MEEQGKSGVGPTSRKRWLIPVISVIIALLIALSVTAIVLASPGEKIKNGISIDGVSVGKLTEAEATQKINEEKIAYLAQQEIHIKCADREEIVPFNELVTSYDVEGAVKKAYAIGREPSFFNRISSSLKAFGKIDIPLDVVLDDTLVTQFIDTFANDIDQPLIESVYKVDGDRLKLYNGEAGLVIDRQKAVSDIKEVISTGQTGTVEITLVTTQPTPLDADKIYDDICTPPQDAKYEERGGKGYIVKAQNGIGIDKELLRKTIEENSENEFNYYVPLEILTPNVTTVSNDNLFTEKLGTYSSKLTDKSRGRMTNVKIALEKIDGYILNPDEVFSYNDVLGPTTAAAGFKEANVYSGGKVEKGIGGGVCQVSSVLYSAVLSANLEVVKRYNHSLIVSYVPYGQDATVASGEIDFRFKNNTNEPLKIVTAIDENYIYTSLYGKKPVPGLTVEIENITLEKNSPQLIVKESPDLPAGKVEVEQNGMVGYVVDTYKNIYINGEFQEREYVSRSRYKALDRIEIHGTGGAQPAAAPVAATPAAESPVPVESADSTPTSAPSSSPTPNDAQESPASE